MLVCADLTLLFLDRTLMFMQCAIHVWVILNCRSSPFCQALAIGSTTGHVTGNERYTFMDEAFDQHYREDIYSHIFRTAVLVTKAVLFSIEVKKSAKNRHLCARK